MEFEDIILVVGGTFPEGMHSKLLSFLPERLDRLTNVFNIRLDDLRGYSEDVRQKLVSLINLRYT